MPLFDGTGLPHNAHQVKLVQENLANAITYGQIDSQYIATAMIGRLLALKMVAKQQEDDFFSALELPSGEAGLKILQSRLDTLNKDEGFRSLMDTGFIEMYSEINNAISQISFAIAQDNILEALTQSEEFNNYIKDRIDKTISGEEFQVILNQFLKEKKTDKILKQLQDIHYFLNSDKRGIVGKIEVINLSEDNPQITWKVDEKTNEVLSLSSSTLKRIKRVIGSVNTKTATIQANLRGEVADILCKLVHTEEIRAIIRDELTSGKGHYDLVANENKIKGFLGELYSAVAFRLITNQPIYVSGGVTGNLNNGIASSRGKEIGIDLVVGNYGMQIKRYRYLDGDQKWVSFAEKESKKLPTMLNNIPNMTLVNALKTFFATMQFNQPWEPVDNLEDKGLEFWEKLDDYLSEIYPVFTTALVTQSYNGVTFNQMFGQYLDRFIRVDQNISNIQDLTFKTMIKPIEGGITGSDKTLYVNTLFNISGKLIPSSVILDSIIEEIENQVMQHHSGDIWDYSFQIQQTTTLSPNLAWSPSQTKSTLSVEKLITDFSVIYHINFNLGEILKQAASKLE